MLDGCGNRLRFDDGGGVDLELLLSVIVETRAETNCEEQEVNTGTS